MVLGLYLLEKRGVENGNLQSHKLNYLGLIRC